MAAGAVASRECGFQYPDRLAAMNHTSEEVSLTVPVSTANAWMKIFSWPAKGQANIAEDGFCSRSESLRESHAVLWRGAGAASL